MSNLTGENFCFWVTYILKVIVLIWSCTEKLLVLEESLYALRAILLARDTGTRRVCPAGVGRLGRRLCRRRPSPEARHGGNDALFGKLLHLSPAACPPLFESPRACA